MRLAPLVLLIACEPALRPAPLPELVAPRRPRELAVAPLVAGESLRWEVRVQGFTIGRIELAVGDGRAESHFATSALASSLARASHDLITRFDPATGAPREAIDELVIASERTSVTAVLAGARIALGRKTLAVPGRHVGHTLHSALAAIRAWAGTADRPGFVHVLHAGELYRVDLAQPFVEGDLLRVEGRVRAAPLALTIWLRARDRVPARIEIRSDGVSATAELIGD